MKFPALHIHIAGFRISTFVFFGVLGYGAGVMLGLWLSHLLGLNLLVILMMSLLSAATFFILAMMAKIITGEETIVYYHHEIAILTVCSVVLRLMHLPVLSYLDINIIGIATFLACGRIGCFNVGCCHGRPFKRGVVYGHAHVTAGFTPYYEGVALFPVQLVESVFVFCMIFTGAWLMLRHSAPGTVLILYTVLYGAFRFGIEFIRGDAERPYWKGLSEAQWTTMLLVTTSLVLAVAGYLPLYTWHLLLTAILYMAALRMVLKKDAQTELLRPRHVKEIASALQELSGNNTSMHDENNMPVINIYQTGLGLRISKVSSPSEEKYQTHYTVSFSRHHPLNNHMVAELAQLIMQLQKHDGPYRITEKQKAVFHISFS